MDWHRTIVPAGRRAAPWSCHALAIALMLLTACSQGMAIPDQRIGTSRVPDKPLSASLVMPSGDGPFPVVILLHGCGGIGQGLWDWTRRLQGWGYATLVLDSFSARGVTTVCSPDMQHLVTAEDRVADTFSAALYLRSVPGIDGERIGVLGQSHGGRTAAMVTDLRYERMYPGLLKAVVDYYGACGPPQAHGTVPLMALAGEADDWGHPALSCGALAKNLQPGQPFEIHTYPDVWHAFDNSETRPTVVAGHRLEYDAAAASDSYQRVHVFFDKWLKG